MIFESSQAKSLSRLRSAGELSQRASQTFLFPTGGERGIRTPKSLRTPVFKTGAIAVLPALRAVGLPTGDESGNNGYGTSWSEENVRNTGNRRKPS